MEKSAFDSLSDLDTELVNLCRWAYPSKIEEAIQRGANVEAFNGHPLVVAVNSQFPEIVKTLLDAGAKPSFAAMLQAKQFHATKLIEKMLAAKAKECGDPDGILDWKWKRR